MSNPTPPKPLRPWIARIGRFLVSGGSAALVNLVLLHALVAWLGLRGGVREDLANFAALEASALCQFALCRHWVWRDAGRTPLWSGLVAFHSTIAATATARLVMYTLLRQWGVHHLVNATLGIALVAIANFLLYDRFVFRRAARTAEK